jgi:N4-gp56 family major capsid protein
MNTNRATEATTMIKAGPDYGTGSAPGGFICFCSTDCSSDVRDLPHFKEKEAYGTARKAYHKKEIGVCEEFTFIVSPLLTPWLAAGTTYDGTMVSAGSASNDVYPMIVMAEDAWGHVALKGNGGTGISPVHVPWDEANHYNPAKKFGFVGASFWCATVRLNEFWMQRIEACASRLNQ